MEDTTVPLDRDERIEARRKRIMERLGAQKGEGETKDKQKVVEEESRSHAQISDSRARIDKLKTNGANEVTKVRIVGDSRENERRINEEVNRQGRRQKLLYEAESSARQNAAVAMKWSALFDKEIPQELLHEIELQKDTCERIILSKDRLIKEFKTELKVRMRTHARRALLPPSPSARTQPQRVDEVAAPCSHRTMRLNHRTVCAPAGQG